VADLHVDLPYQVHYRGRAADLTQPGGQVTAASLRAGPVRFALLSLFLWSGLREPRHDYADFLALLDTGERIVSENRTVFGADGVDYLFSVEGSHALVGHEDALPTLIARGVRVYGLTHSRHNALADSATDRRRGHGGLSDAGRRFVRAVYAAGGLIDVSHCSDAAFAHIAAIARELDRPLIATHSNARALARHPRNLTDDQLRAIAASGGVVGLNFHSPFLRDDGARASIADVVRHARHMIAIMGAEHVAIGSDLDGAIRAARGLDSHAGMPALARALRDAGIGSDAVEQILGGNVARVLGPLRRPRKAAQTP
jgi:membrane dipeptidase